MSLSIFFWNIYGSGSQKTKPEDFKHTIKAIRDLTTLHQFDIIILSECPDNEVRDLIELELKKIDDNYKNYSQFGSRLVTYHKIKSASEIRDYKLITKFTIPFERKLMIVGLHLHGRNQGLSDLDLYDEAATYKKAIMALAVQEETDDIIVVGDFNMDPFERGLVYRKNFNATFLKQVANGTTPEEETAENLVLEEDPNKYPYFYNPSWHLHGNLFSNIPGTFYTRTSQNKIIYHMLDQVLVSPSLIDNFDFENFEIISEYIYNEENISLVSNHGIPKKKLYSDHLPIRFVIKVKNI
ncbi:endonuclease/exonuclease/phosphatase family protein [Priestia megaterium]|uniref:endonuclease/exonuclease/phosphatase family protein n=1 Tax=Priestia megaterium TaxID=1404 RepID=UPI0030001528